MSKLVAIVHSGGEHPLRQAAGHIWGINIVRSVKDLADAPAGLLDTFQKIKAAPPLAVHCACCATPMRKAKGMAVLRVDPPADMPTVGMIPMGLCARCLKEPDDNKLNQRIYKTLTGYDHVAKNWKEMLN